MYISKETRENVTHTMFSFHSHGSKAEERAMIDSGATHNFIDKKTVRRLKLGTHELAVPQVITNVDGTKNQDGRIMQYVDLEVIRGGQNEVQRFFVTNLGQDCIIFGYPWLWTFNPTIDWKRGIQGLTVV